MEITQKIVALKLPEMERKLVASKKPTDADPTWYNLYSDGYVEQGGVIATLSTSLNAKAVTLPVEMADTKYPVQKTLQKGSSSSSGFSWGWLADSMSGVTNTTTTAYISIPSNSYAIRVAWQVSGYAAESEYIDKIIRREFIAY